jgi:spore coat polysaccharide biosynthesis protein SpsF
MKRDQCTAIIVQARYGSSRLPGKVLKQLAGRTILEHVLSRCLAIPSADLVVCSTTEGTREDAIESIAEAMGVHVFRGSETDVLDRYARSAEAVQADIVMRVTSDCPLIDPTVCDDVLRLRESSAADYAANNLIPEWPHGLDCEAFTIDALLAADREATGSYDREHVTPWIRRCESYQRVNLSNPAGCHANLRWTLDYQKDFDFFEALFARLPDQASMPGTEELLQLLDREPDLRKINKHLVQTSSNI